MASQLVFDDADWPHHIAPVASIILEQPSEALVRQYVQRYDNDERHSLPDRAINILVGRLRPNDMIENVLLKVCAINAFYSTNVYGLAALARHITELDIDSRVGEGDPQIVADIARITMGERTMHFHSFATKYCSWHNPEAYPIYDTYVHQMLMTYRRQTHFARFTGSDLRTYAEFKRILDAFRKHFDLTQCSAKDLDKFLWLYGKGVFGGPKSGCCVKMGNVDRSEDMLVTMGDLTVLIDHLFITLTPLVCMDEGNVDLSSDDLVTMGDLTVLIDHLFITLAPLPACP